MTDRTEAGEKGERPPRRLATLLLLLCSLGVALILAEILVRSYQRSLIRGQIDRLGIHIGPVEAETWRPWQADGEGLFHIKSPNRRLVYENRPGAQVTVKSGDRTAVRRTNSSGFRGEEFTLEKRSGVFRIAAVGDSVTIGLYLDHRDVYPKVMERILNERNREACRYQVYNMGVTGYNVEQEVELIRTRVLDYGPDLITIGYVFNDDDVGQDAGLWSHFTRSSLRTWDFLRLRWMELEERIRSKSLTERSFEELSELTAERGVPVLVVAFPLFDRKGGHYRHRHRHETVRALAERSGFLFLDLIDAFDETELLDRKSGDFIHPGKAGQRLAAEEIARFILERADLACTRARS
jgi:lysophospholipase L1-like esterase